MLSSDLVLYLVYDLKGSYKIDFQARSLDLELRGLRLPDIEW